MDIKDKIVVITGGASGIGLGIAQAVCVRGGVAILADIDADEAATQAAQINAQHNKECAYSEAIDVRDMSSIEAAAARIYKQFGRVDILVNNAGVGGGGKLLDANPETVDFVIDVNFKGVWRGISVFGKRMRDQETPSLICITASENSMGYVLPRLGIYAGTKHALIGMADVLRHELPDHMKVCLTFPGAVATNLGETTERYSPDPPAPPQIKEIRKKVAAVSMTHTQAGEIMVAGFEREDFIIPIHPHVADIVETRYREIKSAFDNHAPPIEEIGDQHPDTLMRLITKD